jgi:tRNA(Ile)-lysidine synthase
VKNRQTASVEDAFERALGDILARVSASAGSRLAVAYSGGLDSAALLHLAQSYARAHDLELFAFHVHHGLSKNANGWLAHCERACASLGVRFDARHVDVAAIERDGVEQAARTGRYAALGELCRRYDIPLLLTAHHQDDQAETVLLQLLRGAGLPGLSGMGVTNEAPSLLGGDSPVVARPFLETTRVELEQFVTQHGILHIDDESNADIRYSRNALRHKIAPVLHAHFPGFQRRLARVAEHAQSAQRLLNELAALDWQVCAAGGCIDLDQFRLLGVDRQDNLLRYWFSHHRVRMPSTAWLAEVRMQLLGARADAQVRVVHPDCEVRRHRNKAFLIPRDGAGAAATARTFRWQGEPCIPFPEFGGTLYFDSSEVGVAADWLARQALEIRLRQGGEKLRLGPGRPTRSLKLHYQALDIPAWDRQRLPVVFAEGKLVFAAGVGQHWTGASKSCGDAVLLRWEKDSI